MQFSGIVRVELDINRENALKSFRKKTDFQFNIVSDTAYYLEKNLGIYSSYNGKDTPAVRLAG